MKETLGNEGLFAYFGAVRSCVYPIYSCICNLKIYLVLIDVGFEILSLFSDTEFHLSQKPYKGNRMESSKVDFNSLYFFFSCFGYPTNM